MEIVDHIAQLRRDGDLLATAAASAGPDAPVPTCPEWTVRDLVRHIGGVHRWATGYVRDGRTEYVNAELLDVVGGSWPDDDKLIDWFREGHALLVDALAAARPDLDCWTFLPAPSPLAFWARRQGHETGIHRVDAERAGTSGPTSFSAEFAADGIDELLTGFITRRQGKLRSEEPRTLAVHATDADRRWLVRISTDPVQAVPDDGGTVADCTLRGSADDLYLWVWNRGGTDGFEIDGDHTVLDLWHESVHVRWS